MTNFPILQLPSQKVIIRVLRHMGPPELLLLSLLSRKTKFLVKSVQLKAPNFTIKINGSGIRFVMPYRKMSIDFYEGSEQKTLERPPEKVGIYLRIGFFRPYMVFNNNTLTLEEWLQHCQYIFNCNEAYQLDFDSGSTFDLATLKALIGKFKYFSIDVNQETITVAQQILRTFLPDVKNLRLYGNPFQRGDTNYQKMLTQNFEDLKLGFQQNFDRFSLDDLLICNASTLTLSLTQNFKKINEFLKLWIEGANPRLRELWILQGTPFIPDDIIEGIQIFKEIPAEETISFDSLLFRRHPNRRAVDIRRCDGTRGTIIIEINRFIFLVWN
ncbi:unnamed protein product [Caenorhabditis brenneri]